MPRIAETVDCFINSANNHLLTPGVSGIAGALLAVGGEALLAGAVSPLPSSSSPRSSILVSFFWFWFWFWFWFLCAVSPLGFGLWLGLGGAQREHRARGGGQGRERAARRARP